MIKVENLVKKYGSLYAVDGISFEINDGEIVGLLGPNGAGKTTTLNIITGYLSMDDGTVMVEGVDISEKPIEAKRHIGFLPETPPLYDDMTIEEYLEFVYELKGCTLNKAKHLKEVCDTVKIFDSRNKLIRTLSKGFRQRVGIAGAIVGAPKVIILDEPTVGLDPVQIIEVRNLIRNLGKKHTVILSSHLLSEVQAVCDRVIILSQGAIIADEKVGMIANLNKKETSLKIKVAGPNKEVLNLLKGVPGVTKVKEDGIKEGDTYTFIVEASGGVDVRKPIFNALAKRGFPIMGLETATGELEDAFVKLITNN